MGLLLSVAQAIIIRAVTVADLPAVRTALVETWHATYDGIYGPDKVYDITTRWHSLVATSVNCRKSIMPTAKIARRVTSDTFVKRIFR